MNPNLKTFAALLIGATAGAGTVSAVKVSPTEELRYSSSSTEAKPLPDGGMSFVLQGCADLYVDGAKTAGRYCGHLRTANTSDLADQVNLTLKLAQGELAAHRKMKKTP